VKSRMPSPSEFKKFVDNKSCHSSEDDMSSEESDQEDLGPLCRKLAQDNWDLKKHNKDLVLKMDIMSSEFEQMKKALEFYKAKCEEKAPSESIEKFEQQMSYEDMKKEVGWESVDIVARPIETGDAKLY